MTPLHPEFLGAGKPAAQHVILFTGPAGSGPTAAVASISDIVTIATQPGLAGTPADEALAVGLDYGEILVGVEDCFRIYDLEGVDPAEHARPELEQRAVGLVAFVSADAADPVAVAVEQLGAYAAVVRRGGAVVALTRRQQADPRLRAWLAAAIAERFPGIVVPVFTVDPWNRAHLGTVLLSLVASVESSTLHSCDMVA